MSKVNDEIPEMLTSTEVAELLNLYSPTIKNWLESGTFPGGTRTPDGHWEFSRGQVEAVKEYIDFLKNKNATNDLAIEITESPEDPEPPLL